VDDLSNESYSGRGVQLLRSMCHSLEYSGNGNRVLAVFVWGDQKGSTDKIDEPDDFV
jgi:hypothetical protein